MERKDFLQRTEINAIDLKILVALFDKTYSVSDLQRKIGIAYKNLLPHIKKLSQNGMILIKDLGKGRKKLLSYNKDDLGMVYFMFGILCLDLPQDDLKERKTLYEEVCRVIEQTNMNQMFLLI